MIGFHTSGDPAPISVRDNVIGTRSFVVSGTFDAALPVGGSVTVTSASSKTQDVAIRAMVRPDGTHYMEFGDYSCMG